MELPEKGQEVSLAQIEEICAEYHLHELWAKIKDNPPKKPFKSDGCSLWPDRWMSTATGEKVSIYNHCFLHDLAYWCGLPEKNNAQESVDRFIADAKLIVGVVKATSNSTLGDLMWGGVRLGGNGRIFKLPFSWGFGR